MRRFRVFLTAIAVTFLLTAMATVPSGAAPGHARAHGHGGFDGTWSVSIYTSNGSCGSYRAAAYISGGSVSGGGGDYSLYGRVSGSGAISVTVSRGGGTAYGSGRLYGSHGGGGWRTSSGECSGRWSAS